MVINHQRYWGVFLSVVSEMNKLEFPYVELTGVLSRPPQAFLNELIEHFDVGSYGVQGDCKHSVINEPSCQPVGFVQRD